MGELRERMIDAMRLRNYSSKTIESYTWQVKAFTRMFGRSPAEMGEEEIRQYVQHLVNSGKSSASVRLAYGALRFFYRETLGREWKGDNLPPARREKRLPRVLSVDEVKSLFAAVHNVKHRTLLMTIYSGGLRVREAMHLKLADIDSKRMLIQVEQGKGKKDRYTLLSRTLLEQLRVYWQMYRPAVWLFPGSKPGMPLSERLAQTVFTIAKKKQASRNPLQSTRYATVLQPTC